MTEEQLKIKLDKAIEKAIEDTRKHFEETVIKEFNNTKSMAVKMSVVDDFIEALGYEASDL